MPVPHAMQPNGAKSRPSRSSSVSAKARRLLSKAASHSNVHKSSSDTNGVDAGADSSSSAAASGGKKVKLVKGIGKSGRSKQAAPSSSSSLSASASASVSGAVSLMSGSLPGELEQPTLEDRSDAPPLRMRAENGMRSSKTGSGGEGSSSSSRKLKYRAKEADKEEGFGVGNGVDHTVAPVQQLRVAEEGSVPATAAAAADASAAPSRGRSRDASPVTTDYGEEDSALPEMETPIKSNTRGRTSIAATVRSVSRSLSRSRRSKKAPCCEFGT